MKNHHIIKIEDTLKFQQVVYLLDNPFFLEIRDSAREMFGIITSGNIANSSDIVSSDSLVIIEKWFSTWTYKYRSQIFLSSKKKSEIKKFYKQMLENGKFSYQQLVHLVSETIAKIFRKPDQYIRLIYFSLLRDEISDSDFTTVDLRIFHPHFSLPLSSENNEKRKLLLDYFEESIKQEAIDLFRTPLGVSLCLYLAPPFTMEEIKRVFEEKLDELLIAYEFDSLKKGFELVSFDVRPNIKRDRQWYFDNLSGKTYVKIAEAEAKKYDGNSAAILGQITKAIQSYKKFIINDPKEKNRQDEYKKYYKNQAKDNKKIRLIPTLIPTQNDPAKKSLFKAFK
jgi:hypothetical protein